VKYHLGASSDREFDGNKVHLSLTPNPSHLEIVDPGRAREGARQAGPARLHAGRPHRRHAAPDPRRRRLRRAGRGGRVLRPVGPARPPHRRLDPLHHQQPDRLHDEPALLALVALSLRRRQDDRGADPARERRRPGGGGLRRQGGDRVPAEVPQAGGCGHDLLSPLRPQRGRRAGVHPAADVPQDPQPPDHAADLRRQADRRGRGQRRRRGRHEGGVAFAPRRRIRRRPGLQAEQGRLAGRRLVWPEDGRQLRRAAARPVGRQRSTACASSAPSSADGAGGLQGPPHDPALRRRTGSKAIESGEGLDWATAEALAFGTLLVGGHTVRLSGQDVRARHLLASATRC
jgi:hypothetical protein